jgi:glycosyltransferase involved in cell wall biosynthesis
MKILHVNIALAGGGLEQYLFQLFHELNLRGHENALLYGEKYEGVLPDPKGKIYFIERITQSPCRDLEEKLKLVKEIVEKEDPDLVLVHQVLNPDLVDLLTRMKPSIRFVHGFKLICPDGKKTLKYGEAICPFPLSYLCQIRAYRYKCMPRNPIQGLALIQRAKRMASLHLERSRLIVASGFMKHILRYNGFPENRIELVPLFTVFRQFMIPDFPKQEPVILAMGRLRPAKGMDYLIRAFSQIPGRPQLVILGEGPALGGLKCLTQELRLSNRVSFPGWVPHDRLAAFYQASAVVVVPSIAPESFALVGIEAMAHGKPVVAFDAGGISEWLKDGQTGFLIKLRDEAVLADKLTFLLGNPDLAVSMGSKGREAAQSRFNAEIHVERLLDIFRTEIFTFQERKRKFVYS